MKNIILTIYALVLLGTMPISAETSFEDELKDASSGTVASRFRGGYFIGGGYQAGIGGSGDTKISGFLIEGGLYGLFNPIQNFLDIEVGVAGKYNTGMSSSDSNSGSKTYYAGLKQATIYSGTIFRFGESEKAIAVGVSKAFYISEVQSDEAQNAGLKEHDLKNGIGAYVEYQDGNSETFFVRVEIEQIDVVGEIETNKDTVASILIGYKY